MTESDNLFLGLDSSTQSLKAVIIDRDLRVVYEDSLNFDADLPGYGTTGGAHFHADGLTVTAPPAMWVAALDRILERMMRAGAPIGRVAAISGSGQQHGSVWLKPSAAYELGAMNPDHPLLPQIAGIFSRDESPIWMDSSTTDHCRQRERSMGGAQKVADVTGSRAYERFTGNQIAKIYRAEPHVYAGTGTIALVSSFMPSILAGRIVPIDASDGSGMNLMDIRKKTWSGPALSCSAPELAGKLPGIVPSHAFLGPVSSYFVKRFGFSAGCAVIAWSGDNPCSLAGLRIQRSGDVAISLGTSDTVFGSLGRPKPSGVEGHIFVNPVEPDAYMAMICYKNGSITREKVRDRFVGGCSWDAFNAAIKATPPGNRGAIGFYMLQPEITPPVMRTGVWLFDRSGMQVSSFGPGRDARALVEGQFLSMRLHGARMGLEPKSILATGGASANEAILRVMSDVFGSPVHVGEQPNSAALGAAYRALHGWLCSERGNFVPFAEVMAPAPPFRLAVEPDMGAHRIYNSMLVKYEELERKVTGV